jgi:acyl-CoA synthetase (AMP-forming)/AMP-acid ligase II
MSDERAAERVLVLEHFESIDRLVSNHAQRFGSKDAIIFLERGETETERISYRDLDRQVDVLAAGLIEAGLGRAPIAIALPAGASFVASFLACLRAGGVAIPAPLPDTEKSVDRIAAILADARPAALVTETAAASRLSKAEPGMRLLTVDELRQASGSSVPQQHDPGRPAFVQYTSGSTRAPRGVAVTHGNLIANSRMIQVAFGLDQTVMGASWLPHFHDMGLIGALLQPLFVGGTAVIMPPRAFIQKPLRWLRAIEKYKSTTAGGPCFGYELCVRMISAEQVRTLDLSCWQVAYCGAEPVRASVLAKFAEHFRPAGFRAEAFLPCYGLAETTLIASAVAPRSGFTEQEIVVQGSGTNTLSRKVVSCGTPVEGSSIVLRDEKEVVDSSECKLGEICVSGPHVSPGHWNGEDRSVAPFANVFSYEGADYLPTGDIGAFVDGELVTIDRISDIIILFGANIHAADVEATVLNDPRSADVRAVVAFAVDDGVREKLVILCEVDRRPAKAIDHAALTDHLRKRVAEEHGVVPLLGFVAYGTLPRTSSGKIQRAASRKKFLSEQMPIIMVDPETEIAISALRLNAEPHAAQSV